MCGLCTAPAARSRAIRHGRVNFGALSPLPVQADLRGQTPKFATIPLHSRPYYSANGLGVATASVAVFAPIDRAHAGTLAWRYGLEIPGSQRAAVKNIWHNAQAKRILLALLPIIAVKVLSLAWSRRPPSFSSTRLWSPRVNLTAFE